MLGNVRIEAVCHTAERFLNICAENGIKFKAAEKIEKDIVRVTVSKKSYKVLRKNLDKYGCSITVLRDSGLFSTAEKLGKRYALIISMMLVPLALIISATFVWELEVVGNERVSDEEILACLDDMGIGIGTFKPTISQKYIANEMPQRLKDISFAAVNITGSKAEVVVRETYEKPRIINEEEIENVYAVKAGIIEKITVFAGTAKIKVGDTVSAGDILVLSEVESMSSGTRRVNADAEVYARTTYEISRQMPCKEMIKTYTGPSKVRFAVCLCGKRINLYFNGRNTHGSYDKIITLKSWRLGDIYFPLQIIKEKENEFALREIDADESAVKSHLEKGLVEYLGGEIGKTGEIIDTEFSSEIKDGVMIVTMKAECMERIDTEEKTAAGKEDNNDGENYQR